MHSFTIVVISTHFLMIGQKMSKHVTRQLMQQLNSESSLMFSSSTFSKHQHILHLPEKYYSSNEIQRVKVWVKFFSK